MPMPDRNTTRFTLPASERLKLRKQIETLFQKGEAFSVFPLRVMYFLQDAQTPGIRAGFSVPKKKMRLAVQRNRIKRLLREAWRLQKHELQPFVVKKEMHLFFIFTGKEMPKYDAVFAAVKKAVAHLKKILSDEPAR